tara:strand:- start:215 stop:439 length:225 start_codon:yes stop_codon:yes gene_type:complete
MAKKKRKETNKAPDNVSKYELKDKRVRARNSKGHFIADDPSTPHNEAYGEKPNNTKKLIGVLIALLLIAIYVLS